MAPSSRSVPETLKGSHEFVIEPYSRARGIGVGKYLSSRVFNVGEYRWAIYFYPDGIDDSEYVSVFIALAGEGKDVTALFELTLMDQSGKGKHKVYSQFDRSLEEGWPYTLKNRGSMWGYKRYFRRDLLEASNYLKDDCLKFKCTVGVVVPSFWKIWKVPMLHSKFNSGLFTFKSIVLLLVCMLCFYFLITRKW